MNSKSIFIDKFNFFTLFYVVTKKKVNRIYLLDSVDFFPNNVNNKKVAEKIYTFFNKEIIRVPFFEKNKHFVWEINKKSIDLMEKAEDQLIKNGLIKFLSVSMQSEKSILAFKQMYLPYIYRKLVFLYQLDFFYKNNIVIDYSIYTSDEILSLDNYIDDDFIQVRDYYIPLYFKIIKIFMSLFNILFNPYLILDIIRKGISFLSPVTKNFDLAVHLVWGFPINDSNEVFKAMNNISDAEVLNYSNLKPSSTLFVNHSWIFSEKIQAHNSKSIREIGAQEGFELKNKIPMSFLLKKYFFWGYLSFFLGLFKVSFFKLNPSVLLICQKMFVYYLSHEVFCKYYLVNNFFSRDDYDARSTIRTIVQNHFSLKHSGLAHSSFLEPKYLPFTLYTHYDYYYIPGDGFKNIWSNYYNNNREIISVGAVRDKLILDAISNQEVKSRFIEKYKNKTTVLFLISPIGDNISPEWLYVEKYKDLHELLELNKSIHLIIRPRSYRGTEEFFKKFPKLTEYAEKGRITCELNDFTTQELVAHASILITEDASSVFLESLCRDDLFSISYTIRYGYSIYWKGLVANNIKELKSMIMIYFSKDSNYNYMKQRRNEIADSYVEQPFGHTWERISENLLLNQK